METIKLNYKDLLIIDPGYIKEVRTTFCDITEPRFDALKLVKELHSGDDGEYEIRTSDGSHFLGVDSGRIWELSAEFECEVEVDSGLSGYIVIRTTDNAWGNDIEKVEGEYYA